MGGACFYGIYTPQKEKLLQIMVNDIFWFKRGKVNCAILYGHYGNGDCQYFDILVINVTQNVIRCVSLSDETMNTLKIVLKV